MRDLWLWLIGIVAILWVTGKVGKFLDSASEVPFRVKEKE